MRRLTPSSSALSPALAHTPPVSLLSSRGALPQKPSSEVLGQLFLSVLRAVCGARVLCYTLSCLPVPSLFSALLQTAAHTHDDFLLTVKSCFSMSFRVPGFEFLHHLCRFWFKVSLYPLITITAKCAVDHPVVTLFGYDLAWGHSQYL